MVIEYLARPKADAAPGATSQREMVLANGSPQIFDSAKILQVTGNLMQLGQTDQIPAELIGLAGRYVSGVSAGQSLFQ